MKTKAFFVASWLVAACASAQADCENIFSITECMKNKRAEIARLESEIAKIDEENRKTALDNARSEAELRSLAMHLEELIKAAQARQWQKAENERLALIELAKRSQARTAQADGHPSPGRRPAAGTRSRSVIDLVTCSILSLLIPETGWDLIPIGKLWKIIRVAKHVTDAAGIANDCL